MYIFVSLQKDTLAEDKLDFVRGTMTELKGISGALREAENRIDGKLAGFVDFAKVCHDSAKRIYSQDIFATPTVRDYCYETAGAIMDMIFENSFLEKALKTATERIEAERESPIAKKQANT